MAQINKEWLIILTVSKKALRKDLRKERKGTVHFFENNTDRQLLLASHKGLGKSKLNTGYAQDMSAPQF